MKSRILGKNCYPSIIGIDEKSYRKEHKYITLVYDMENNCVDYIAYYKKEKSLDGYYEGFTEKELSSITAVSMDMWDPFMSSTTNYIPDANLKIVLMKNGIWVQEQ